MYVVLKAFEKELFILPGQKLKRFPLNFHTLGDGRVVCVDSFDKYFSEGFGWQGAKDHGLAAAEQGLV